MKPEATKASAAAGTLPHEVTKGGGVRASCLRWGVRACCPLSNRAATATERCLRAPSHGRIVALLAITPVVLLTGCMSTGTSGPLFDQFRAYDAARGTALSLDELTRRCAAADVVFFGEQHDDMICNQLEAELLHRLARGGSRPALSMEFFERDTQAAVDQYLSGKSDEIEFMRLARQKDRYLRSHRPLVQMCRAMHLPLIAANSPRALVRGFRQVASEYPKYLESQDAERRAWLPRALHPADAAYRERFFAEMGMPLSGGVAKPMKMTEAAPASMPTSAPASSPHGPLTPESVERMFAAQCVWDASMAESVADFRSRSRRPVLHVVGSFHVANHGGLVQAYRALRPRDRVLTLVYRTAAIDRLALQPEDAKTADIVLYGVAAEEKP